MTTELRNCPFCGEKWIAQIGGYESDKGQCTRCGATSPCWNTRPLESALEARVKELEKSWAKVMAEYVQERLRADSLESKLSQARKRISYLEKTLDDGIREHMASMESLAKTRVALKRMVHQRNQARAAAESWEHLVDEHNLSGETAGDVLARVGCKFKDSLKLRDLEQLLKVWFGNPNLGWDLKAMSDQVKSWKAAAVRWVEYDGTPETLPEPGKLVLVHDGVAMISERHPKGIAGAPPRRIEKSAIKSEFP